MTADERRASRIPAPLRRLLGRSRDDGTTTEPREPTPSPRRTVRRWVELQRAGDTSRADALLARTLHDAAADDPATFVTFVEEFVLAEAWEEAVATWAAGQVDLAHPSVTARTAGLLTRAHRALGHLDTAERVAAAGLARWPDGDILDKERAKVRADATDWSAAVAVLPDGDPPARVGAVSSLGALAGDGGAVEGWLEPSADGPTTVTVELDGHPVAVTRAVGAPSPGRPGSRGFALRCDQLREYLGDGVRLQVRAADVPLRLPGGGTTAVYRTGYPARLPQLHERLESGAVFAKRGRLRPGHTADSKRRTLALYRAVASVVEATTHRTCTPFYGNLLGAIRERDLIAHDIGGFDIGYVSVHPEGPQVRREFAQVARHLLDEGYHLVLEPWSFAVRRRPQDRTFVDLNVGRFTPRGELHLSYGWRYDPVTDAEAYHRDRWTRIAGEEVPVPGCAEAVLEQCYGPGWSVPDPGFDIGKRLRRDAELLLSEAEMEAIVEHRPGHARIATVLGPDGTAVARDT